VLGQQFRSLLGAEHKTIEALPEAERTALATGILGTKKARKAGAAAQVTDLSYSHDFLASLPAPTGDAQWQCLTKALYFESRGESLKGQFAVAEVILNRVDSAHYPNTVCSVVEQGGRGGCQFSYHCDGARDVMRDGEAVNTAGRIARLMLDGAPRDLTFGATHFHTRAVNPRWSHIYERTAAIGAHVFYKP
jgi:spore germination cell wall hydrolase CwlJ-like protein